MPAVEVIGESSTVISGLTSGEKYVFRVGWENADGSISYTGWTDPLEAGGSGGVAWTTPTPLESSDAGNLGDIAYDSSFFYVYTSDGWKRSPIEIFGLEISISQQPSDVTASDGGSATFSVVASAGEAELTYQWESSADGGTNWSPVAGETSATLSFTASASDDQNQYRVVVSSTGLTDVTSSAAALTIAQTYRILAESSDPLLTETGNYINQDLSIPVITITADPQGTDAVGGSASFSVSATVSDGSSLSYQWQANQGGSWTNLEGENLSSLSLVGLNYLNDNTAYRVVVSAANAADVTSSAATLSVPGVITISSQPSSVAAEGGSASFSVSATASNSAPVSYQWYESTNGGASWTAIAGETQATLTLSGQTESNSGNQYKVIVSGAVCPSVESQVATLTVAEAGTGWYELAEMPVASLQTTSTPSEFGEAIAVSGDSSVIVVGAPGEGNQGDPAYQPETYVYKWNGASDQYERIGNDFALGTVNEMLGSSVAVSGDGSRIAIGPGGLSSSVYVFDWDGTAWNLVGSPILAEQAKVALSSDGTTLAIGDWQAATVTTYTLVGGTWTQGVSFAANLPSIALNSSGSRLVVGQYLAQNANGLVAGMAQVFDLTTGSANVVGQFYGTDGVSPTGTSGGHFGFSVAIDSDGNAVAIGEPSHDNGTGNTGDAYGKVHLYRETSGVWNLEQTVTGANATHAIGSHVAIGADGNSFSYSSSENSTIHNSNGQVHVWNRTMNESSQMTWAEMEGSPLLIRNSNIPGAYLSTAMATSSNTNIDVVLVNKDFSLSLFRYLGDYLGFKTDDPNWNTVVDTQGTANIPWLLNFESGDQTSGRDLEISTDGGLNWSDAPQQAMILTGLTTDDDGNKYRVRAYYNEGPSLLYVRYSDVVTLSAKPAYFVSDLPEVKTASAGSGTSFYAAVGTTGVLAGTPGTQWRVYLWEIERDPAASAEQSFSALQQWSVLYYGGQSIEDEGYYQNYTWQVSSLHNGDRFRYKFYYWKSNLYFTGNPIPKLTSPEKGKYIAYLVGGTSVTFSVPANDTLWMRTLNGYGASVIINQGVTTSVSPGAEMSFQLSAGDSVQISMSSQTYFRFWLESDLSAEEFTLESNISTLEVT
jgi:hypothetical protein